MEGQEEGPAEDEKKLSEDEGLEENDSLSVRHMQNLVKGTVLEWCHTT